ncbi:MAG: hypothetical protein IJA58_02880 [Lachnospiraceae bacterium]|nr:hypothetical protein [Lachnospiraceae bacterium]
MLIFTAEDSVGYDSFLTELTSTGFTLYAENEIADNLYPTWINDSLHLTTAILAVPLN